MKENELQPDRASDCSPTGRDQKPNYFKCGKGKEGKVESDREFDNRYGHLLRLGFYSDDEFNSMKDYFFRHGVSQG